MTVDEVRRFADLAVPEHSDLEFKRALWQTTPDDREELAKDVVAMANSAGGLIVVGIATVTDVASAALPFAVGDAQVREVVQTIANRMMPHLPIECYSVNDASGIGYLIIEVPASPIAPHAIWDGEAKWLKYPVRVATRTVYLTESDVAQRYVQRSQALDRDPEVLALMEASLVDDMSQEHEPLLVVSANPLTRIALPLSKDFLDSTQTWWQATTRGAMAGAPGMRADLIYTSVAFERVELGVSWQKPYRYFAAHLYADGRVALAQEAFSPSAGGFDRSWRQVQSYLAVRMFGMLHIAASHFVRLGVVGFADLRVSIVDHRRAMDVELVRFGRHGEIEVVGSMPADRPQAIYPTASSVVEVGEFTTSFGQAIATHRLGSKMVTAFGVAELGVFTANGELQLEDLTTGDRPDLEAWAQRNGLAIADSDAA